MLIHIELKGKLKRFGCDQNDIPTGKVLYGTPGPELVNIKPRTFMDELLAAARNLLDQRESFFDRNPSARNSACTHITDSDKEYVSAWDKLQSIVEQITDEKESTTPMATHR